MERPNRQHRRSMRLRSHDYAQAGAYFVTICAHGRACLFGDIAGAQMRLNEVGQATAECWVAIPEHFPHVSVDAFVTMPNHVHGILFIAENVDDVGAKDFSPLRVAGAQPPDVPAFRSPSRTLGSVVRGFKIGVTKLVRANTDIHRVWQRNYYEHVIRDESDLDRVREYIATNPARWLRIRKTPITLVGNSIRRAVGAKNRFLTQMYARFGASAG